METQDEHTDIRGVYTLADIDTFTFGDIERTKNKILTELSSLDVSIAALRLKDLFTLMRTMLEKYFDYETISRQRIIVENDVSYPQGYNFYDLMQVVDKTHNMDVLRRIVEYAYINYNKLIKPIVSLPTVHMDWKKKLVTRLFSIVQGHSTDDFYNDVLNKFKITGAKMNTLNFFRVLDVSHASV